MSGSLFLAETQAFLKALASQHGGLWISLGVLPSSSKEAGRHDPNYLGAYAGAMAQTPSDASVEDMLQGDLDTARAYGERVAAVAARWKQG